MSNHFLKASDEATLRAALIAAGILSEAEEGDQIAEGFALDVIGVIHKPTGNTVTVDGVEIEETAPVPGWHANLAGDLSAEQLASLAPVLLPEPVNPYRVWAA